METTKTTWDIFPSASNLYHGFSITTQCFLAFCIIVVATTYAFTSCRFYLGCALGPPRYQGQEPLTLPYTIPWVGSGLDIILNPHRFYESTYSKSPNHGPIRIRVANLHMYFIAGADRIQAVFRNSKHLSFEFMQLRVANKVKGLPLADVKLLKEDDSGTQATSYTLVPESTRIWRRLHTIYGDNLAHGKAVDFLTAKFIGEFTDQLLMMPHDGNTILPIYSLLQDKMFQASTMTLAGPSILSSGQFAKHFWDYDAAFMTLLQGAPRFLCRKGWNARDQCLEATKSWLSHAWEAVDWNLMACQDPDWDPLFGHRLIRAREQALSGYGVSLEGRAAMQLGLIWAINANAIPMTAYIIIELIKDPLLLRLIRDELLTATTATHPSQIRASTIDIEKLCSLPLLTSTYKECLRLRASIPLTRRLRNDIEIDGQLLKAGNFILSASWLSHMDPDVWATSGHPVEKFWAARFLYKEKGGNKIKAGDFFPYGGGSIICPGRFFAKQEILAAVMIMVLKFDMVFIENVELDGKTRSERGPEVQNCESRGIISLDRDVRVRLRARSVL